MNTKLILVSLIAVFAVLSVIAAVNLVSAVDELNILDLRLSVKGVEFMNFNPDDVSLEAGETVPVKVVFTAGENVSDVKVKIEISTHRDDISASTERFKIYESRTYSKLLSLKLPEDFDSIEGVVMTIRIEGKVDGKTKIFEQVFDLTVQRKSFNVELLSVEAPRTVNAGNNLPVNVVLKNRGADRLDDLFVVASIPELGIEKKVYFSDLTPVDVNNNKEDAVERTIYLSIPGDSKSGEYTLEVSAYNPDVEAKTTKKVTVVGSEGKSDVLATTISKNVAIGGTVSYDLVIVNTGNDVAVYEIVSDSVSNLVVSVAEPIITVAAGSSKVVKVTANAGNVAGTYSFGVNVNSKGELVKRLTLTANVTGAAALTNNIVVLTVVLAIIFIVLLIVLIVLLTRKPAKAEEFGESYY